MKFNVSIYWIILSVLTIILLSIFIGHFVFSRHCESLNTLHKNQIEIIKEGKDSVIKANYHQIHKLELSLDNINSVLTEYESKVDSLQTIKEKVKVVYRIKYKEIEVMSDTALVNYWKNEFTNE